MQCCISRTHRHLYASLIIGNELAGEYFWKQLNDADWASTYLTRSYELFVQWGALGKSRHMQETYGKLIDASSATSSNRGTGLNARTRFDELSPNSSNQGIAIAGFNAER